MALTRVVVGRLGRPHGVRGEVTVEVRTDEPELRFAPGSSLSSAEGTLRVETARWHGGRLLLTFQGVSDRNAAEALRGRLLEAEVDEAELPSGEDEYYDRQLVGLRAVAADGSEFGVVAEVLHLPAQDLLVIKLPDDRDVMLPFVTEFVPRVDLAAGSLTVAPPEGLMEEVEPDAD